MARVESSAALAAAPTTDARESPETPHAGALTGPVSASQRLRCWH